MLVCQATLFDYAFAEISIPQFPILPQFCWKDLLANLRHKSYKKEARCYLSKKQKPNSQKRSLYLYNSHLKGPTAKVPFHLEEYLVSSLSLMMV